MQIIAVYGIILGHDMCRYALMREVAGRLSRGISAEYVRFINRAKKLKHTLRPLCGGGDTAFMAQPGFDCTEIARSGFLMYGVETPGTV